MPITTAQAQSALKSVASQWASLTPATLITLFEIDASQLASDAGISDNDATIFRFHNNVKLLNTVIWWKGLPYTAAPIFADKFEMTGAGTLPRPILAISVNPDGVLFLGVLKSRLRQLGDLVGAKVTRRRTFAAYLDAKNFLPLNRSSTYGTREGFDAPDGFTPDPTVEFPPDIYYIDRKSAETKSAIEFELASVIDVEGLQLPMRRVIANRCQFQYRGMGCGWEWDGRRDSTEHESMSLPQYAPPVATVNNELIANIIKPNLIVDVGAWDPNRAYQIGHSVYRTKNNVKFYFVAKVAHAGKIPPDEGYWIADVCAKDCVACRLRWATVGQGYLPIGSYPAANRIR